MSTPLGRIGWGDLCLDRDTRELFVAGNPEPVCFTWSQYAIVEALLTAAPRVVSREALMRALYGHLETAEIDIVQVFVWQVRKKLAKAGAPDAITTARKTGYRIRGDAEPVVLVLTPARWAALRPMIEATA